MYLLRGSYLPCTASTGACARHVEILEHDDVVVLRQHGSSLVDQVLAGVRDAGVDVLDPAVGLLPPVRRGDAFAWTLASRGDALRVGQLLLRGHEVMGVVDLQDQGAVGSCPGVEGRDADVDADDPLGLTSDGDLTGDLNGERHCPLARALGHGGRDDPSGTTVEVAK